MHRLSRAALVAAVGVLAMVGTALPASAHAELERTFPTGGARTSGSPSSVRLVFSEPVRMPAAVIVRAGDGSRVTTGATSEKGSSVISRLPAHLPGGRYTVAYRVVSDDGHPVSGQFTFTTAGSGASAAAVFHPSAPDSKGSSGSSPVIPVAIAALALLAGVAFLARSRVPR